MRHKTKVKSNEVVKENQNFQARQTPIKSTMSLFEMSLIGKIIKQMLRFFFAKWYRHNILGDSKENGTT